MGEFSDCILAVGLDDAVFKPVFHHKTFQMLKLMSCWPFSRRDDRAAQAGVIGDVLNHGQDDDVLWLVGENSCCWMRVVHEAVVQLDSCCADVDVDDVAHYVPLIGHRWGTSCDTACELSCVELLLVD